MVLQLVAFEVPGSDRTKWGLTNGEEPATPWNEKHVDIVRLLYRSSAPKLRFRASPVHFQMCLPEDNGSQLLCRVCCQWVLQPHLIADSVILEFVQSTSPDRAFL